MYIIFIWHIARAQVWLDQVCALHIDCVHASVYRGQHRYYTKSPLFLYFHSCKNVNVYYIVYSMYTIPQQCLCANCGIVLSVPGANLSLSHLTCNPSNYYKSLDKLLLAIIKSLYLRCHKSWKWAITSSPKFACEWKWIANNSSHWVVSVYHQTWSTVDTLSNHLIMYHWSTVDALSNHLIMYHWSTVNTVSNHLASVSTIIDQYTWYSSSYLFIWS